MGLVTFPHSTKRKNLQALAFANKCGSIELPMQGSQLPILNRKNIPRPT